MECRFCSMTVPRGVTLRAPLTVDLLQLGTDYIIKQLKQVRAHMT